MIYYTDIVSVLRDEFLEDNSQTPFFVSQGTGREQFIADAKRLDSLRARVCRIVPQAASGEVIPAQPTLRELLEGAERKIATPDQLDLFVGSLFDQLNRRISTDEFADFFDIDVVEHPDFTEPTARAFIIRVLDRENRPDDFVTAKITRQYRNPLVSSLALATASLVGMFGNDREFSEIYDLDLNRRMKRAQMKITLTPKFNSLRRLVLVVSCAPSLEHCYVIEMVTQHRLRDFAEFEPLGEEVVRRWYKLSWQDGTQGVAEKVATKLGEVIRAHLESTETRLAKEKP